MPNWFYSYKKITVYDDSSCKVEVGHAVSQLSPTKFLKLLMHCQILKERKTQCEGIVTHQIICAVKTDDEETSSVEDDFWEESFQKDIRVKGGLMSKHKWTDEDVAHMLGWTKCAPKQYHSRMYYLNEERSNETVLMTPGFFTAEHFEADANAVMYVLPWIKDKSWYLVYELDHGMEIITIEDGCDGVKLSYATGDHFGPTLCRACLMALEAVKMDVSISEYLRFLHKAYRDSVSSP